ncbi:MAG TPA: ROK family protein [Vicinamibacterales bacterium]|nr:ROK family protein [Vicinamibacterales bacterium]
MKLRIGIDLGGTKIEGIALDGSKEVARLRVPTPRDDYDATVGAIATLTAALETRAGASGSVGVGIPGALSPSTGLVKNANSTWLIGRPLADDLAARLGREVRIANDANCFAMSEAADGAAAGAEVVFGVILGTGTGAGIVVRGSVLTGANAIAGEWGHIALPWAAAGDEPAPGCYCGKRGCIETYLSGPGLSADHERHTSRRCDVPELLAHASGGDVAAQATLDRYVSRAARGLAAIINVLDPDVVVLGGGLSNIDALYERIPRLWGRWVFAAGTGEAVRTRLVRARHGDSSGVRGAAWLWPLSD